MGKNEVSLVDRRGWLANGLIIHRRRLHMVGDAIAWLLVLPVASALRHDFDLSGMERSGLFLYAVLAIALQLGIGTFDGLYRGRYSFGSFEEVAGLVRTMALITFFGALANAFVFPVTLPRSVPLIAAVLAFAAMGAARYGWRHLIERHRRPTIDNAIPALIFGAGEAAEQLLTSMLRDRDCAYVPVALLDDDPAKSRLRLRGVPVAGTRRDMAQAKETHGAIMLIIAVPSASGELVRDLSREAAAAGLQVRILPPVGELLGAPSVADVRRLSEADLLGRHEIDTDEFAIADYLTGRRVLVTGAGGSIGSELCRQIHEFRPASLIMLDRDESALHGVQLSIEGRALLEGDDLVVADIRDHERLHEVFALHRPEVVFHAAALKHLSLLEKHPVEGVKTNVRGTLNVLNAAMRTGVDRFVNLSTDKAADPTSMLGYTKRLAERLTAWAAGETNGTYLSVRFGNVLGSRGSVLTAFRAQIELGGPVTVTDPEVTRYFMTVEEAVQLVIQAGSMGHDGEALVLDMGRPVRIAEVAQRLIDESGKDIDIVYTGLRPGEKLHEVLRSTVEPDQRPHHPLISHVRVPPLEPHHVVELAPATLVKGVQQLCEQSMDQPPQRATA